MKRFMPLTMALLVILARAGVTRGLAQSAAPRPVCEVASVKPALRCDSGRGGAPPSPGRLNISCTTLRDLVRMAYDSFANGPTPNARRAPIVGGPAWIDSDRYDIAATAAGGASLVQMAGPMLQGLLEDRFKLRLHRETREVPVYLLSVANSGLKSNALKKSTCAAQDLIDLVKHGDALPPNICGRQMFKMNGPNLIADFSAMSVEAFANGFLSSRMDRPVIDQTGLAGQFDFRIEFLPDSAAAEPPDGAGPSIFTAVQEQLGLKLSAGRGTIQAIVIDAAERPAEN